MPNQRTATTAYARPDLVGSQNGPQSGFLQPQYARPGPPRFQRDTVICEDWKTPFPIGLISVDAVTSQAIFSLCAQTHQLHHKGNVGPQYRVGRLWRGR